MSQDTLQPADNKNERRIFPRAERLLSACFLVDGQTVEGAVLDLSANGAKVQFDAPPQLGDSPVLRLTSTLRLACPMDFSVDVAWSRGTMLGLRFLGDPYEIANALAGLLPEQCFEFQPPAGGNAAEGR